MSVNGKTKKRGLLARIFPEQRIYFKSNEKTRHFTLSPLNQALLSGCAVAAIGWMTLTTSLVVIDRINSDSEAKQAQYLKENYETRIAELISERDSRAQEALAMQERYALAVDQISTQQSELLKSFEKAREFELGIEAMREKLQLAVKTRNAAIEKQEKLAEEIELASTGLPVGQQSQELAQTLDTISGALSTSVTERDTAIDQVKSLETELASLETQRRLETEAANSMFDQLEEAVDIALVPMENLLSKNGLKVESILDQVKGEFSGAGGPFEAATVSTRTYVSQDQNTRFTNLLKDLDRVNLAKIASNRVPYAMPVKNNYRLTSSFGVRRDPINGRARSHNGLDMAAPLNTPIYASADGVVTFAGYQRGYGKVTKIRHGFGYETFYAHQNRIRVKVGQKISKGDRIGDMGTTGRSTGVHLHYEVRLNGTPVNPMTLIKAARNVYQN